MTPFPSLRIAYLAAAVCFPATVACSSDDGHGPVVGAPTTPVVISEGGTAQGGSSNPNAGAGGVISGGGTIGVAGSLTTGMGGSAPFGSGGSSGGNPFGSGGSSGGDPFGTGGTSGTDPFGVGGTANSFSGTPNSFSGSSF